MLAPSLPDYTFGSSGKLTSVATSLMLMTPKCLFPAWSWPRSAPLHNTCLQKFCKGVSWRNHTQYGHMWLLTAPNLPQFSDGSCPQPCQLDASRPFIPTSNPPSTLSAPPSSSSEIHTPLPISTALTWPSLHHYFPPPLGQLPHLVPPLPSSLPGCSLHHNLRAPVSIWGRSPPSAQNPLWLSPSSELKSFVFPKHTRHVSASGPLHWLVPLPGTLFLTFLLPVSIEMSSLLFPI